MDWKLTNATRPALTLCALLVFGLSALAQPAALPDLATARPVVAAHGMVVSQEATASRIGLDILKRGGNAVDDAVAVGFARSEERRVGKECRP